MSTVSLSTIRAANKRAGLFFFQPASMRFFASRIESRQAYATKDGARAFFVTSEQFTPSTGTPDPRKYTVRRADLNTGDIRTEGTFQGYASKGEAAKDARLFATIAPIT